MKKILLFLISIFAFHSFLFSQKKDKSSSFEMPEGYTYVLQLKNGNSFFMDITRKDGIKVMLFDTIRKKIASSTLDLKLIDNKVGRTPAQGLFEVNGDVVIFLNGGEDRTPALLRAIVDGKTGKLKSEEKIAELDKIKMGAGYALVFGGVEMPDFKIVKDPESDYYAVVRYNTFAAETKDRIEVLHFSPEHKIINRANYVTPDDKFKYTNYLSCYVNRDNYVILATYAFNTDKTGGDEGRFYVSQLSKGKTDFKQQALPYTDFYKSAECIFVYSKASQMLNMALITNMKSKGTKSFYEYHFQNINPATLKVGAEYAPDFSHVNTYYIENMARKDDYFGILRKIGMDKSGNMILFFQHKKTISGNSGTKVYYGDVALLTLSPTGKTIDSAVFPASHYSDAGGGSTSDMSVVIGESKCYILFDNTVDNMQRPETEEAKTLKDRGPAVPVKYTYYNSSVKKEYLFKEPKEKKGNPYCDFSIADYNPATKKYATLYIDPEKEKACLIWLTLE